MRHIFIINPAAGKLNPLALLTPPIRAAAEREGCNYEIYTTTGPGDAFNFVQGRLDSHCGPVRFYACGGDGTLNEVACALAGHTRASLGIIPCGSGNDFIKILGKDRNFFDIAGQLEGEEQDSDIIRVNDRYSINLCSIGLDADVGANMARFKKWPLITGATAYNLSLAYCLCRPMGHRLRISFDGEEPIEHKLLLMVAANGSFYGGQYRCAPKAQIDDGLMDVCLVDHLSRLRIPPLISAYKEGRHVDDPRFSKLITYRKCRRLTVWADRPVSICIDGEMLTGDRFDFELLPRAIRLSLPKSSPGAFERRMEELCSGTAR